MRSLNSKCNYLCTATSKITLTILFSFSLYLYSCSQSKNGRNILGRQYAESELKSAVSDKTNHNAVDGKTPIIKDSLTAIAIAEPILFRIYGKDNITKQRPYETYLIDNYWVLFGTLPKGYLGGTFLIIIDARNSSVIKITHGK